MACFHDLPALQVESAVALSHVARNSAPAICNDRTVNALKGLLCTGRKDIEHPAASALSSISCHPECQKYLVDAELTSIVQRIIHSNTTTQYVRDQLTQALNNSAMNVEAGASLGSARKHGCKTSLVQQELET